MPLLRRHLALATTLGVAAALVVPLAPPAQAQTVAHSGIVSDNPAGFTPNVLDGKVNAFAQVGNLIIAGGSFTRVQASGGGTTYTRNNVVAFNAATGAISTTFAPNVAGEVYDVEPAGDGTSVFVSGQFSQVNSTSTSKVARLNVSTGAKVAGFATPTISQIVKNLDLVNGRLLLGGSFKTIGGQSRPGLASLDPSSGALTSYLNLPLTQPINGGDAQVLKMAVSPDGSRLVAVGNFTQVAGQARSLIAMISLNGTSAAVSNWSTDLYQDVCADAFDTYMRDLDFSPDSTYFVVSTTGAYGGPNSPCDVITRWESAATGSGLEPTWRDYTGGDTTYAVAVTGAAIYVGGHMRWLNNPGAGDAPGPGAVPREGIAALDPVSGLPLSWNPGRARGVGVFDLMATSAGLWVGSDTDRIGGETHRKIAFFPLEGGPGQPAQKLGHLPDDVYQLGRLSGSSDAGVLYRVNAGGGEIQSADDGPDWSADDQGDSPWRNSGSNSAGWDGTGSVDSSVPHESYDRAPAALFSSERWDPADDNEMVWSFPVDPGTQVTVRVYVSNRCSCTSAVGDRVFDIGVEGQPLASNLDLVAAYGDQTGVMLSKDVTSDGAINIAFGHEVENPLVNGIEIIRTGSQVPGGGGPNAADAASKRFFDGTTAGTTTPVSSTVAWGSSRGAFLVDNMLYAAFADGTFTKRSYNGTTFGSASTVNLYGGSFGSEIPNLTGLTYSGGRIYYSLFGDGTLHWRWFTPQSDVVGETRFDVGGANGILDPSRVRGMFLSGSELYFADRSSGDLFRMQLSGTTLSGPLASANSAVDWTARSLFVSNSGSAPVNQPPVAHAAVDCHTTGLTCDFSSAGSNDPEGQALTYLWNFGDGATSTSANPSHTYGTAGSRTVTLTVRDPQNSSGTDTVQAVTVVAPGAPVAGFTSSCAALTCTFTDASSGTITSRSWDFGDGQSSSETSPSHTYSSGNTYSITLTVTGPGGNDTESGSVTVPPVASSIGFRGQNTASGNSRTLAVPSVAGAQASDVLLLFVSSAKGTQPANPPGGWTLVGTQADGADTRTTLYRRVGTAGGLGTVTWSANTKTQLTVLAYSGAASVPAASASAAKAGAASTTFTAPAASVGANGSAVVSFWMIRSGSVATWTVPSGTTERSDGAGTGSGQVGAASADQLNVATGTSAARTATASVSSAKGIGWTVVLAPA